MRHSVESRLQRALAMLAWLYYRDPVPLDELAERFEVSRHQLLKDLAAIDTMAPGGQVDDELFAPTVVIDEAADTVQVDVPQLFRPRPKMTRAESFAALAVGSAALELLDPEDAPALATALRKLADALEEGHQLAVDFDDPLHLDAVRRAAEDRRRLEIAYWSAWRDERTTRRIDPYRVFYAQGEWYAPAWCHLAGGFRRFRVDRILTCTDTGETFEPRDVDDSLAVFTAPTVPATRVLARFPAEASWVPEYVAGELVDEDDDGFTMWLTAVGETWLARLLLRTGGEVLEPEALVPLRRATARRVLARYEG